MSCEELLISVCNNEPSVLAFIKFGEVVPANTIKAYIERHPELSENNRKWLYVNASQRVTLVVFGRKAKKLAEDLGVAPDNLRDALTPDELILLQEVEDTAIRLIDIQDVHPDYAIQQTAERLLIQVQSRALKLK